MNTKGDSNVNMVFLLLYFLLSQSTIPATGKAITIPKKVRTISSIRISSNIWGVIRSGFLRVGENEAKSVCL